MELVCCLEHSRHWTNISLLCACVFASQNPNDYGKLKLYVILHLKLWEWGDKILILKAGKARELGYVNIAT